MEDALVNEMGGRLNESWIAATTSKWFWQDHSKCRHAKLALSNLHRRSPPTDELTSRYDGRDIILVRGESQ